MATFFCLISGFFDAKVSPLLSENGSVTNPNKPNLDFWKGHFYVVQTRIENQSEKQLALSLVSQFGKSEARGNEPEVLSTGSSQPTHRP